MKYAYEDLDPKQFEDLIIFLCQNLLGMSVQGFTTGPDGGRDAKFVGTAELHPSKASPWIGTTIVQAKHTNGYNKSFSDTDFYSDGSESTVLGKELPRIKKLRDGENVDNYMLFANRRLAGNAEHEIRKYLSVNSGIPESSIYLCDIEQLERFLKRYPEVADLANIDPIDSPLIVSPDELADVVSVLGTHMETVQEVFNDPPTPRVPYEHKNLLNHMTDEYAKLFRRNYLKETAQIKSFLAAPENMDLLKCYDTAVEEFNLKITSKRKDYQTFDEIIEYLTQLLFSRDAVLRSNKRLTRAVLFYMYWNCDIGTETDATTN